MTDVLTAKVFVGDTEAATLLMEDNNSWHLEYLPDWQARGFPLAPLLPVSRKEHSGDAVINFFRNMLPENPDCLDHLQSMMHIARSNTSGMLLALGSDLSGAVRIAGAGHAVHSDKTTFREITPAELGEKLSSYEPTDIWDRKPRLSVAGVQDKLNVLFLDGKFGLGEGNYCSTHILKFDKSPADSPRHLVLNEYMTMRISALAGLRTANAGILDVQGHRVLLVERFDRKMSDDKSKVLRRHCMDACQALGISPSKKYEWDGPSDTPAEIRKAFSGMTTEKLASLTAHAENPFDAGCTMLQWLFFNLLVGNNDAHGKNFSFFISRHGLTPTPLYDLISTDLYTDCSPKIALSFDDEFLPDQLREFQLASVADLFGINAASAGSMFAELCRCVSEITERHLLPPGDLTEQENEFVGRYLSKLQERCRHFAKLAAGMHEVQDLL